MNRIIIFLALLAVAGSGCKNEPAVPPLTEAEKAQYTKQGQDIAKQVSVVMTSALTKSISDGGVGKAAQYCSYIAIPMIDTLAVQHGVSIRRTSTLLRNAKDNAPTGRESEVLAEYQKQKAEGRELKPLVESVDPHTVAYYQPIIVQPLCLNCHGELGNTLTEENYAFIKYLYPNDKAIGYALEDLRGIWSMQFPRKISQTN